MKNMDISEEDCRTKFRHELGAAMGALITDLQWTYINTEKCFRDGRTEEHCVKQGVNEGLQAFSRIDQRIR